MRPPPGAAFLIPPTLLVVDVWFIPGKRLIRQTMQVRQIGKIVFKIIITLIFTAMGGWLFYFNWLQRPINYRNYTFLPEEAQRLQPFASAQYAYGLHVMFQNNAETAAAFFRQAVSQEVLFMDAWLGLAEAEAALGHKEKSSQILKFTADLTESVFRWKWPQMLIARDLGINELLFRNTNYLLSHGKLVDDALQLLHIHFGGNVTAVSNALNPDTLVLYLDWLIRRGMTVDSMPVWQRMHKHGKPDSEIGLRYANYLLDQKRLGDSMSIWLAYFPLIGIFNGGFEREIVQGGFGWRCLNDRDGHWKIERVSQVPREGQYTLRISFSGRRNISFQSAYQIFPVNPLQRYRLSYAWKSEGITTDQGPFIEISGYDQAGLSQSGHMITGTHRWQEDSIEFRPPAGCSAAVVGVRRRMSNRFDSKIGGLLWLDDFRLETLSSERE